MRIFFVVSAQSEFYTTFAVVDKISANRASYGYGGFIMMTVVMMAFLVLNLFTPEYHDDFVYKFVFEGGAVNYDHPIRSIGDIFASQVDHYSSVNGRSIIHCLVQLFTGLLGKTVFNLLNALVFCAFIYLLKKPLDKCRTLLAIAVPLVLVLLMPRFKDTFLWMTGSINYLWSATAALLFLLMYEKRRQRPVDWSLPAMVIAAFLLGWTHEGITLPLGTALVIVHLCRSRRACWHDQGLWLALAYLAGGCMIVLAPGTVARSGMAGSLAPSALGLRVITGFTVLAQLKVVYLALLATVITWFISRNLVKQHIKSNGYLLLAALLSLGIVFSSGLESTRTAFGLELFSMIYLLRLLGEWLPCQGEALQRWCGIILAVGLVVFYGLLMRHTIPSWQESHNLIAQIELTDDGIIGTNEHNAGCFSSYVCTMLSLDSTVNAVNYDSKGWPASIAATYGRDSLVFLPQAFLDDIKAHPDRYDTLDMDRPFEFYVQRIDNDTVIESVTFELAPNDFNDIPVLFRPIARRMNRYTDTTATAKWATVTLYGNRYLLIKRDHSLARRILGINY